jgi:hypothetical protein
MRITMTNAEANFKFFDERMAELKRKFSMPRGLQLASDDEPKSEEPSLADKVRAKDRFDQTREGKIAYGHCWSPFADKGKGGPVRLWYSVSYR